jgi:hypothetical protein
MRLTSLVSVSAPDAPRRPIGLVGPLAIGPGLLAVVSLAASQMRWLVDAAWFGSQENFSSVAVSGISWVSAFLASAVLYVIAVLATPLEWRWSDVVAWSRKFLGFLMVLYWLVSLHSLMTVASAGAAAGMWLWDSPLEILLVSSLSALLWPLSFRLPPYPVGREIFSLSLVILGVVLLIAEPDVVALALAAVGLLETPQSALVGGSLPALPYLTAIAPLLWAAFDRARQHRLPR